MPASQRRGKSYEAARYGVSGHTSDREGCLEHPLLSAAWDAGCDGSWGPESKLTLLSCPARSVFSDNVWLQGININGPDFSFTVATEFSHTFTCGIVFTFPTLTRTKEMLIRA